MSGRLDGTVALVTGGANGIGLATCTTLAARGAAVAITDVDGAAAADLAERLRAGGARAASHRLDVTDAAETDHVVEAAERALGPIGLLVANAGVSRFGPLLSIDEDEWDRVLAVNLKGVFLSCRSVLPGMLERRAGRIVTMSSVCGKEGLANLGHYCASKFGVIGLSQSIAAEVAAHGVTVNAVCPGIVATPLKDALVRQMTDVGDFSSEREARTAFTNEIPLGRPQTPQDVAEMVAFLASSAARNLTGGTYHVDGGLAPR